MNSEYKIGTCWWRWNSKLNRAVYYVMADENTFKPVIDVDARKLRLHIHDRETLCQNKEMAEISYYHNKESHNP